MQQHGVMTLRELEVAGVPRDTVFARARSGRYQRLLPGVYAVEEPTPLTWPCAVTRWKPSAVLSHRTAAWLWGLGEQPAVVEATVGATTSVRGPAEVRLHRRRLEPREVTSYRGMATVTPERALLDLHSVERGPELERLVDDCPLNPHVVAQLLERSSGTWGVVPARRQLRLSAPGTASEPERVLSRALVLRGCRLEPNARVGRYRADLLHRRARVIVEVDGRAHHSAPVVFVSDRVRQNALQLDGWLVLRYAAATVLGAVDPVADEVVAVVRRRRRRG